MSNELMTAATGSRALAKGLELLHALAASEAALPLRELAKVAGLGKASTQRLLQTLVATGFAAQDADNAYRWNHDRAWGGPTEKLAWQQRLREVATPILRELNADLAETVSLAVLIEDHIRVLDTWESPRHIRLSNYRNRILPPNASSLGKAIAAFQPAEAQLHLLHVYGVYRQTPNSIVDPIAIREEFARTRERGWACEIEETVVDGCCFAAPILAPKQRPQAAISVSLPKSRLTPALRDSLPSLLIQNAAKIARRLRS